MIDTDKYEGHTLNHPIHMDEPNPHDGGHREMLCDGGIVGWLQMDDYPSADVNAMLLADAPLLLAEVKRLHHVEGILDDYRAFHTWIGEKNYDLIAEWDKMESEEE